MGDFIMEQEDKNMQAEPSEAQENPKKQPQPKGYEAYLSLFDLVRMLAVITLVFVFFFRLNGVSGSSMYPTLVDKDYLVLESNFLYRDAKQGDIVVLYTPPFSENDELLVKRVIGLPGDTITFADGYVYINGEKLEEEYLPVKGVTECDKSFTVPEGCFFPMGDNRTGSNDARSWANPYVKVSAIQAKPFLVISVGSDQSWQGIRLVGQGGRS